MKFKKRRTRRWEICYFRNGYWIAKHKDGRWCVLKWEDNKWVILKKFKKIIEARKFCKEYSVYEFAKRVQRLNKPNSQTTMNKKLINQENL